MISLEEIEKSIIELEKRDTTYATCEKLADLYICKDHMTNNNGTVSVTDGQISDFISACNNLPIDYVLRVVDGHMQELRLLYPKEYDAIIKKLLMFS